MANYTTNYNLKKPLETEKYNVEDQNGNMDILDVEIKRLDAQMTDLVKVKQNVTIASTSWVDDTSNSGYWKYDIADADITADTIVDVNVALDDLEKASNIKSSNNSFAGYVSIYADLKPTENIVVDLRLTRQAGGA